MVEPKQRGRKCIHARRGLHIRYVFAVVITRQLSAISMAPLYDISCVFFNFSDGNFADDGRIPQDFFKILGWNFVCHKKLIIHMPYPSVLDFLKIKLEKSNLTNWIFSLFWTGLLPPA